MAPRLGGERNAKNPHCWGSSVVSFMVAGPVLRAANEMAILRTENGQKKLCANNGKHERGSRALIALGRCIGMFG